MISVLIVDDEISVCNLIQYLVPWEELGLVSLGYANNGPEAYRQIHEKKPDIVITDIRMPGLSGLELIEKLRGEGSECLFIIVSGYREFEFAQQAIRFGVEEYLLKPLKKEDLKRVLTSAKEKIKRHHQAEVKNREQAQWMKMKSNLRKNWLSELKENVLAATQASLESVNREYGFSFQPGIFQGVVVHDTEKTGDLFTCENRYRDFFQPFCHELESIVQGRDLLFLLNYREGNEQKMKAALQEQWQKSGHGCMHTLGWGTAVADIHRCAETVRGAVAANSMRWWYGKEQQLFVEQFDQDFREEATGISQKKQEQLKQLVETLDAQAVGDWCRHILETYVASGNRNKLQAVYLMSQMESKILEYLKEWDSEEEPPLMPYPRAAWRQEEVWEKVLQCFCGNLEREIERIESSKQTRAAFPVRTATQYLQKHFPEKISLEEVAELVHLNPAYFSNLFKKEIGMNFSRYLMELRINEAKKLLKESNMNIAEIADQVGYSDARHFSKTFQGSVGISPREYRKLHS